jgi:hypothetical protein
MTQNIQADISAESNIIDIGRLLALANKEFGKAVDCDMRGSPITDCDVLLHGAYGPAVLRLVNLSVQRGLTAIDMPMLRKLAPEAFHQAVDHDFGGNRMTDYGILLMEGFGYGETTLRLVTLALQRQAELRSA